MTKLQYIVIIGTALLFGVLYFGCNTKAPGQKRVEQSRSLQAEATSVDLLIKAAHDQLPPDQLSTIRALQQELSAATEDTVKTDLLRRLSGRWYANQQPAIAGHYAQEVAEIEQSEDAWSIAGTTYSICVQRAEEEKVRTFCNQRAVNAFQSAISLAPKNVRNQINLALTYTEVPPTENPMKGILMLRELEQNFPDSSAVFTTLARLAIKTGQFERASQRLQRALELDANNLTAICLLADAYAGMGNTAEALAYSQRCQNMRNGN